jgi:hypothetical protein
MDRRPDCYALADSPTEPINVLEEQRFKIANGELESLNRVDAEDRTDRRVVKADELHRTVGILTI